MSDLFRKEAIAHVTRRLDGVVTLATPIAVRVSGLALALTVIGALVFAFQASYARKETVVGWVTPDAGVVRASTLSAGTIDALEIEEGSFVEAGQILASVRTTEDIATGAAGAQLGANLIVEADASARAITSRIDLLKAEQTSIQAELARIGEEISQANISISLQEEQVNIATDDLARSVSLAERGILAQRETDQRQSALVTASTNLADAKRMLAALERQHLNLNARLSSIPLEITLLEAERDGLQASFQQRSTEIISRTQQVVVSPVAGRVAAIPVQRGQRAAPGTVVAVIIPDGTELVADLYVPTRAAGFIRPDQEVRLKIDAFPHQRFGTLDGTISNVSRTVLAPNELDIPGLGVQEPVFSVRVALPAKGLAAYGEIIPLQPGMLLHADIVIDRRSLIEWLLDPVFAARG